MNRDNAENREILLKVEDLCQYFKSGNNELKAVDGVSFDIYKGEVFGLVGESGCGKTTTGRSIIKLYKITSGNVWFKGTRIAAGTRRLEEKLQALRREGRKKIAGFIKNKDTDAAKKEKEKLEADVQKLRDEIKRAKYDDEHCNRAYAESEAAKVRAEYEEKRKNCPEDSADALDKEYRDKLRVASRERITNKIQMIFQDPIASLNPRMTVRDTIAEGLIIKGIRDKKYIDEQVYKMLDLVGLVPEHAGRYPHEFSGGQRQRIGIARAIIMNPELIIADEPISALDVSIQAQVINLLNDLRKTFGLTVLFIAHDLSVVKYFSDRIAVMYFGKIVELADADELFAHPLHPYTRSLLSAIPLPDPVYEKKRKRVTYNPLLMHDYSENRPTFREVGKNHFVLCNDEEFARYKSELNGQ